MRGCLFLVLIPVAAASYLSQVQEWNLRVQEPALMNPHEVRWIYFSARLGGLADRFTGLMDSLLFAVQEGRALAIEWESPVPLPLKAGRIRWDLAPPLQGPALQVECQAYEDCREPLREARHARVIRLATNTDWTSSPAFNATVKMSQVFAHVFRRLFEIPLPVATARGVCVQIRTGHGGGQIWTDSEQFLSLDQMDVIAQRVRELQMRYPGPVFITSDSVQAAERLGIQPLDLDHIKKGAEHVDKSPNARAAFPFLLRDFLALQKCRSGVLTERSGFGRLGVWLAGPPVRARLKGRFFLALRKSRVQAGEPALIDFCQEPSSGCV